jgi:hypothetical protein
MDPVLIELAKSGPWAVVAGWLLWQAFKEKAADRETMKTFMYDFRVTLDGVRTEIGNLAHVQMKIMEHLESTNEQRTPTRRG